MNLERIAYFKNLDLLLSGIYRGGENLTAFDEIFPNDSDLIFPLNKNNITPIYHPILKSLELLISQEMVGIRNGKYFLTGKGINRVFGNGYESEYRKLIEADALLTKVQKSTILRNTWLSATAIIISILALVVSIWL